MPKSTLLFVHGTGVRSASYGVSLEEIRAKATEFGLPCHVEPLLWGEVLGIDFEGLSLPSPVKRSAEEQAQALRWEYLQVDPLFDLKLWCTPAAPRKAVGGDTARELWEDSISQYKPGPEVETLLRLHNVEPFFASAWATVVGSGIPEVAFAGAGEEDASLSRVFAEAVTAQMMHDAAAATPPVAVPATLARRIVTLLLFDWKQTGKDVKDIFLRIFGSVTKSVVRPLRSGASRAFAPAIGDILYYVQYENGNALRTLIRDKVASLGGTVFVLSHSLGGVACFETMVESRPANVAGLITAGSQAPLLFEFGALTTLRGKPALPQHFPPWLNFYDENDLLSYCADPVFGCKADRRVDSMLPPLEAHSAYWKLEETWITLREFMKTHG